MSSKEEDLKLLQAVRDWRPPATLHPIAIFASKVYLEHDDSMPPEAIQKVRDVLNKAGDDLIALAEALEGLTRFMVLLQTREKTEDSQAVADLMREYIPRYEPFWIRVGEALENVGTDAQSLFRQFVAADAASKSAPTYGEKAPEGTVPLKNMIQPGRPPPWAKKPK